MSIGSAATGALVIRSEGPNTSVSLSLAATSAPAPVIGGAPGGGGGGSPAFEAAARWDSAVILGLRRSSALGDRPFLGLFDIGSDWVDGLNAPKPPAAPEPLYRTPELA